MGHIAVVDYDIQGMQGGVGEGRRAAIGDRSYKLSLGTALKIRHIAHSRMQGAGCRVQTEGSKRTLLCGARCVPYCSKKIPVRPLVSVHADTLGGVQARLPVHWYTASRYCVLGQCHVNTI
jgi:hypothetical protein